MPITPLLLETVLRAARARGIDQAQLAQRARLPAEVISRAACRGTIDLGSLQALAEAVDLRLVLEPMTAEAASNMEAIARPDERLPRSPLADPRWGLAWSNPDAPPEVLVRNALVHGSFDLILEAVLAHGLAMVKDVWKQTARVLPVRARREVERKLRNIESGLAAASA